MSRLTRDVVWWLQLLAVSQNSFKGAYMFLKEAKRSIDAKNTGDSIVM